MGMKEYQRIGFTTGFSVASFLFIVARGYVRYWILRGVPKKAVYYLNDIAILIAWVLATAIGARDSVMQDKKADFMNPNRVPRITAIEGFKFMQENMQTSYYFYLGFVTSIWLIKGSFLCNYYGIAGSMSKWMYRTLIMATVFTAITYCVVMGLFLFSCMPPSRAWSLGKDNCFVKWHFVYSIVMTSMHLSSDIAVMSVGVVVVRLSKIGRGRRERVAIFLIFFIGLLTVAAACLRFGVEAHMNKGLKGASFMTDKSGERMQEWLVAATVAEINVGMMAACLPAFRVWIRRVEEVRTTYGVSGRSGGLGTGGSRSKTNGSRFTSSDEEDQKHLAGSIIEPYDERDRSSPTDFSSPPKAHAHAHAYRGPVYEMGPIVR